MSSLKIIIVNDGAIHFDGFVDKAEVEILLDKRYNDRQEIKQGIKKALRDALGWLIE